VRAFDQITTEDADLNRVQDRIANALSPVFAARVVDGRLVESVALTTSAQSIAHGLDRAGVKWIVVSPDADARVWQTQAADSRFVYLQASAAVNVNLWVF